MLNPNLKYHHPMSYLLTTRKERWKQFYEGLVAVANEEGFNIPIAGNNL
jgi:hypothetical protein